MQKEMEVSLLARRLRMKQHFEWGELFGREGGPMMG